MSILLDALKKAAEEKARKAENTTDLATSHTSDEPQACDAPDSSTAGTSSEVTSSGIIAELDQTLDELESMLQEEVAEHQALDSEPQDNEPALADNDLTLDLDISHDYDEAYHFENDINEHDEDDILNTDTAQDDVVQDEIELTQETLHTNDHVSQETYDQTAVEEEAEPIEQAQENLELTTQAQDDQPSQNSPQVQNKHVDHIVNDALEPLHAPTLNAEGAQKEEIRQAVNEAQSSKDLQERVAKRLVMQAKQQRRRQLLLGAGITILIIVLCTGYFFSSFLFKPTPIVPEYIAQHLPDTQALQSDQNHDAHASSEPNNASSSVIGTLAPQTQNNDQTKPSGVDNRYYQPNNQVTDAPASPTKAAKKTPVQTPKKTNTKQANTKPSPLPIKPQTQHRNIGYWLKQGYDAYLNSNFSVAQQAYLKVLSLEPKQIDALLGLAAIAVVTQQTQQAAAYYTQILKINPKNSFAQSGLLALNHAGTETALETNLKILLAENPNAAHLHFAMGNVYAKRKHWPQAQSSYFKAWSIQNKNANYAYNLAVSLDHLAQTKQAIKFYQKALSAINNQPVTFSKNTLIKRINELNK